MASSLEVMRQRITSPGVTSSGPYPVPPQSQRRLLPTSAMAASQAGHQSRLLPVGFAGRHSWTSVSSPPNTLLSNRIQRLNLRLSAPTPGEEDLCRHWMQNSAKYSRRQNAQRTTSLPVNSKGQVKKLERPRTVQTPPGHTYKDVSTQRVMSAGKRKLGISMTSPNPDYMTSSDSERIASPSVSQRSSPTAGMRKLVNRFPSARQPSPSSYSRGESPGNSPNSDLSGNRHDSGDARSQPRPPSARPSEARWRNRARASYSPPNVRTGSAGKSKGNTCNDVRRWSLSEAMMHQQNDSKDDDSAYSSSREVTIHTDRVNVTPDPPGSPPRSAPNLQMRDEHYNSSPSKITRPKGHVSRVMVSGQDGRPVFYYHHNQGDNRQLLRHGTGDNSNLLPLRQAGNTQRPKTQPAMGTQHSRSSYKKRPNGPQNGRNLEDKLAQRVLPQRLPVPNENKNETNNMVEYHVGPNFYPISLSDYDALNKQRMSIVNEQNKLKSVNRYIDPEVGQRIIQWLAKVEQNPDLYYGFETDLFGGSIRSSDSK